MAVQQSGNITPGHIARWVTTDVIEDGGNISSGQQVLSQLLSADFNTLSDQALLIPTSITAFMLTGILVTNATSSLTTAVGGFYPQQAKGGSPAVLGSQVYSTLTSPNIILSCTLTAVGSTQRYARAILPDWAMYLSLSTAQGIEAFADVYLLGIQLA